jgi:hypothetical protein
LLTVRKLFIKKVFKKITQVFKKIVKPVVQVLKKAAPYIGAAVGAVGGFIVGGPAGAFSVAQTVLNACIPKNTLRIRCDAK